MNVLSRASFWSTVLLILVFLTGCGGGGGGSSAPIVPGSTLTGQITVPALGSNSGSAFEDPPDNDAYSARSAGVLGDGDKLRLDGAVTPELDPLDVLRVRVANAVQVQVQFTTGADSTCHVFEIASGRELAHLGNGEHRSFHVGVDAFDLVVASGTKPGDYQLDIQVIETIDRTLALPLAGTANTRSSEVQARYLGAHHAMVAGEIVVLREPRSPERAVDVADCERLRGGAGPIDVYRVVAARAAPTTEQGARLEQSLELQTALLAKRIATMPGVRAASPNYIYREFAEPNDQFFKLQWHYRQMKLPLAWDITKGSSNVIVGVLDSGVVLDHFDLEGRLIAGYDMIADPERALDGDGRDPNPYDPGSGGGSVPSSFHGTHVAGTIGAKSDNQLGTAGVDWNCKMMPIRALGKGGRGTLDDIANGILFAARLPNASAALPPKRVDVLNMSLGSPSGSSVMENACRDANAAGVLLIAAAGNDNTPNLQYPASYDSVLSVGAVDLLRQRAPYSNYSNTIDIWAPGGDASVDRDGDGYSDGVLSTSASGYATSRKPVFDFKQGTSMAAPHVAGAAALLLSVKPNITLSELKSVLQSTAQAGKNLPNNGVLIDVHAALLKIKTQGPQSPVLVATPNEITLEPTQNFATTQLANKGPGFLTFDDTKSGISYTPQGVNWVTNPTVSEPASNIDFSKFAFEVDRTGLANGDYVATASLIYNDGQADYEAKIKINLRIGPKTPTNETIYIIVVDFETLDTKYQAETTGAQQYHWDLPGVGNGTYLLAAGTDRDGDDILGDEGELFGFWPNTDLPELLSVQQSGQTIKGLDFTLNDASSLGAASNRRTFRKLPATRR